MRRRTGLRQAHDRPSCAGRSGAPELFGRMCACDDQRSSGGSAAIVRAGLPRTKSAARLRHFPAFCARHSRFRRETRESCAHNAEVSRAPGGTEADEGRR
jgi:hypothetical protein